MTKYQPGKIEQKWQKRWETEKSFVVSEDNKKKKAYILIEFPYPSGDGLHVGHVRSYSALDAVARKKRLEGKNVLFPMGWDAFGLPTENYAIKTGVHPRKATDKNIATFRRQLKSLGLSFDWSREVDTTDPKYYKWTQWIFLQLFKAGLAYQSEMPINWCPSCKIGLANEEVVNGKCERCGAEVTRRQQKQWMLKITEYADRLLKDLDTVDYLPKIKTQQANWIGRSEGAEILFPIKQNLNFVLLHPYRGSSKASFMPWLKKELEKRGHKVWVPDLPGGDQAKAKEQIEFLKKSGQLNKDTIVISHSLSGPLMLKYLEQSNHKIFQLLMVAPPARVEFLDDDKRLALKKFCDWKFDFDKIKKNASTITIISDSGDTIVPASHAEYLSSNLLAEHIILKGATPHFQGNGSKIPEIFDYITDNIKVFTTRPDTIFGATYMVLAPEHSLVENYKNQITNYKEVEKYIKEATKKSDLDRTDLAKAKTGVELKGLKAINPATREEIPIWIADYVLTGYGTGAIMAVPAHDQRDFEFAKKFNLPIRIVIEPETGEVKPNEVFRKRIVALVHDPKTKKVLTLDWGDKYGGHLLIGGGIEKGEDVEQTAQREIEEETGYTDVKFIDKSETVHHHYVAFNKGVNRVTDITGLFFELNSAKKVELKLSPEEKGKFQVKWLSYAEAGRLIKDEMHNYLFRKFIKSEVYTGEGIVINSKEFDGLKSEQFKKKITEWLEEQGLGSSAVNYKLRDWVFSRQHYWGEPIPIIHCEKCGVVPVPEKDLPVELPHVEKYKPTDTGESPLATVSKWVKVKCPECKGTAKRETDTMPNWAGSSWYFLRYCDPKNDKAFADQKKLKYWIPVDLYNGGMEHTTLHLLYSRFWHKFLFDKGLVPTSEPYKHRHSHGIILAEDGRKMSKSFGNVINPDELVKRYGADSVRMYEMFIAPFEDTTPWSTQGLIGVHRFLQKVWDLCPPFPEQTGNDVSDKLEFWQHKTIKKVTDDIDNMRFNTAVSSLMEYTNFLYTGSFKDAKKHTEALKTLLVLLFPMAPHIASELWEIGEFGGQINQQTWPQYDPKKLVEAEITLVVQINGKVRDQLRVPNDISETEAVEKALSSPKIKKYVTEQPKKTIFVKNKLINFVV